MKRVAALVLSAIVLAGCVSTSVAPRPAAISHVVLIRLDDPSKADELIADSDRLLATIPGVVSYAAGKHLDTGRTNVLGDYDVGLYIGYDSTADYATYVEHPQHIELVRKWAGAGEIIVRDFRDPTP